MTWYLILLVISACVLIGQTVLSFIGGEIDVDMDTDIDSSDMLSFKGIVYLVRLLPFTENLYKQFADIDIAQYPLYF